MTRRSSGRPPTQTKAIRARPTKTVPSVATEHHRRAADRSTEFAKAAAGKTGTVSILWLVAVAICWSSIEAEVATQTSQVAGVASEYEEASRKFNEAEDRLIRLSPNEPTYAARQQQLTAADMSLKSATAKLAAAKTSTVEFKLPTLPSFQVATTLAPGVLSAVILFLAIYVSVMRSRAFMYLARSLSILRSKLNEPIERVGELVGPRPWWAAPLPRRDGHTVTAAEFAVALGWTVPKRASLVAISAFWMILICIQLRLTYMGLAFSQEFVASPLLRNAGSSLLFDVAQAAYVGFMTATLSIAALWLKPAVVPDYANVADEELAERRAVLRHARNALVVATVLNGRLSMTLLRATAALRRVRPRFRIPLPARTTADGPDGLRYNPKSHVVHVVSSGVLRAVRSNQVGAWKDVPLTALDEPRMAASKSSHSESVRTGAAFLFSLAKEDAAFGWLLSGIQTDFHMKKRAGIVRPLKTRREKGRHRSSFSAKSRQPVYPFSAASMRGAFVPVVDVLLYDLVAREAKHRNRPDVLGELFAFIETHGLSESLAKRKAYWQTVSAQHSNREP